MFSQIVVSNTGSDPELGFQSSQNHQIITNFVSASGPDAAANFNQIPWKKRSKWIKVDGSDGGITSSGGGGVSVSKSKYVERPDPDAPKITIPCRECGKRFWSMNALFGHMRWHSNRPPNIPRPAAGPVSSPVKEIIRSVESMLTMEDHEAAASLLMLAYGGAGSSSDGGGGDVSCRFECSTCKKVFGSYQALGGHRASHKNAERFLTSVSRFECSTCKKVFGSFQALGGHRASHKNAQRFLTSVSRFECSTCKKVFGSYQALGGHRASHKNAKRFLMSVTTTKGDGCCEVDQQDISVSSEDGIVVLRNKCSICLRVFSSGPALGGHKKSCGRN